MPAIPGFVGGQDVQRSLNLSDNKCVNLYPTTNDNGSITAFYNTPGLSIYSSAASVFSGLYTASNGRSFAVAGTTLYEITTGGTLTSRGTITAGTVSKMTDNGIEMIIVNGTDGWLFTFATNTLAKLSSLQANFTVTIANPAVFTSTNHGLIAGDAIQLSTTTGTVTSDNLLSAITPATISDNYSPSYSVVSPDNNFAYVLNSGTAAFATGTFGYDCISQFVRNTTTGELSPVSPQYFPLPAQSNIVNTIVTTYGALSAYPTYSYTSLAMSPDGNFIYATYRVSLLAGGFVYVLQYATRNIVTGALTHSGFVLSNTSDFAHIAFTSDGAYAYITNTVANTISQYSRNTVSGALTPLAPATIAATSPTRIVMAPDNSSVYAISNTNVIYQFSRNLVSGLLSALGTPTIATGTTPKDIIISGDGKSVYVANYGANTISQYSRNVTTFLLTALTPSTIATSTNPQSLVISSDGVSVYCANWGSNTISMFSRDSTTSLLSVLSVTTIATDTNPYGICISPNGSSVYVTNFNSNTISQYSRNASSSNIGLPTGLSTLTTYYVLAAGLTANNFEVSLTPAGTPVATSGVQAGVHTFTTLAGGFPNGCKTVTYIDGRFVACQPNTQNFYVSDVLRGNTWQTVNVQTADSNPDYVVGQVALHNELIVFCEQSGEVFYDSGQYPSPFVRNVSGIFEVGCIAPYSIAKIDNSVMWLGRSNTGQGVIYRLNGYTPVRLSTYAIEYAIQTMTTITDAQAFTYQQEGHHFYVITFPTGGRTFVYDINTNLWHERQSVVTATAAIGAWTNTTTPISGFNPLSISWNGTVFCAIGVGTGNTTTNVCYTSPDGINWTQRTLPATDRWCAVSWNGTVFCAVSGNAFSLSTNAATSPDGITWTLRTLPANATWIDITWNGSVFCAISWFGTAAATSPDGITWTLRTLPSVSNWKSIAWNGNLFCVITGISNISATSPDGVTWTQRTLPATDNWVSIAWNGVVFCAIAGRTLTYGTTSNVAATSPDGITWTLRTLPETVSWTSISNIGNSFLVVNATNNNAYISTNGSSWSLSAIPGGAGNYYAVGNNGSSFCTLGSIVNAPSSISGAITYTYTYGAWEGREYAYFDNKHLVTDAAEGRIYYLDMNSFTDGGVPKKWIRSFRCPPSDMKRVNHHKLWLEFEAGVGNTNAPNPQMSIKYSNDGGHTWSVDNWRDVSMGAAGAYTTRIFWYRLGMTTGQPRIYELSGTAPARVVLINAYLE